MKKSSLICSVTAERAGIARVEGCLESFINLFSTKSTPRERNAEIPERTNETLVAPAAVNYVAKASTVVFPPEIPSGALDVIWKHVDESFLYDRVRVKGGAYGVWSTYDPESSTLAYVSYRDPQIEKTLEAYDAVAKHLRTVRLTRGDLDTLIIGTIGDLSPYRLPRLRGSLALRRTLCGITDELRQQRRDEVFSIKQSHFRKAGEALMEFAKDAHIAVLGSEIALEQFEGAFDKSVKRTYVL